MIKNVMMVGSSLGVLAFVSVTQQQNQNQPQQKVMKEYSSVSRDNEKLGANLIEEITELCILINQKAFEFNWKKGASDSLKQCKGGLNVWLYSVTSNQDTQDEALAYVKDCIVQSSRMYEWQECFLGFDPIKKTMQDVCITLNQKAFAFNWEKDSHRDISECMNDLGRRYGLGSTDESLKDLKKCTMENDTEKEWKSCMRDKYQNLKREVMLNVKAIKTAEIQYESAYSSFVPCDEYPARVSGKEAQDWVTADSGGFEVLNWRPDGDVYGSYSVKTTGSGGRTDFTVIGVIDIDGDGEFTTYTATKSMNPTGPTKIRRR